LKLGTNEPKKVLALGGLLVVAGAVWFINRSEDPAAGNAPSTAAPPLPIPKGPVMSAAARRTATVSAAVDPPRANVSRAGRSGPGAATQEFRPTLKPRDPNERIDPASIDPTLKLELLARLQKVSVPAGQRSLFDFSAAPLPPLLAGNGKKTPEPKIPIGKLGQAIKDTVAQNSGQPAEPPKPPPPPIPLKFYGFTSPQRSGAKRAFFLDGDDIVVANEGDLIKKRYKVIRIGLSSAVLEDTEVKHQQTLPLVAELTG